MPYLLTVPTRRDSATHDGDSIWSRVKVDRGRCLSVHDDGRVTLTDVASADADIVRYWPGGRTYTITDADAAVLQAAGYGAYLVLDGVTPPDPEPESGITVTDNGDGTATITGVVDNGDGTTTITDILVVDNGDGTTTLG